MALDTRVGNHCPLMALCVLCGVAGGLGLLVRAALLPAAGERLPGPAGAEAGGDGEPPGRQQRGAAGGP